MKKITKEIFRQMVDAFPEHDDLDRCNCEQAGYIGHWACGICKKCNKPRFICGHLLKRNLN